MRYCTFFTLLYTSLSTTSLICLSVVDIYASYLRELVVALSERCQLYYHTTKQHDEAVNCG